MEVVLQSESSECGLACLTMVAGEFGCHMSLFEMRQRFSTSLKGINLNTLIGMADRIGLQGRPVRVDLDAIEDLELPCILHWDLNHFVVLERLRGGRATILDPAKGRRTLSLKQVSEHFTGVALELSARSDFRKKKKARGISLWQLTERARGFWRSVAVVLLLSLALQVFALLTPFYMQWVVDQVLVSFDQGLLFLISAGFLMLALIQVLTSYLRGWAVVVISSRLGLQWMGNVFSHLLKLPLDFFVKRHIGDISSRVASIQTIQKTLTTSFVEALIDGLMGITTLIVMLIYSPMLALVTLIAVLLYWCLRALMFGSVREATEEQLVAGANQQSYFLESVRGMQALRIAGRESTRGSAFLNLMNKTINHEVTLAKLSLGFSAASQLIFSVERVIVISVGALMIMRNQFTVGMLFAYLAYKDQFSQRLSALVDRWVEFRMLKLHGERIGDIVLTPAEDIQGSTSRIEGVQSDRVLEAHSLRYAYSELDPEVVKGCSFALRPGEVIAIVGPSGCGKTTLLKLLVGVLKPSSGEISFNGTRTRDLGLLEYRKSIGVVMQDDQLFAGSIRDNIAFSDEAVDTERLKWAVTMTELTREVASMPMGLETLVGDMGTTLSGGQKQRVVLARALYRQPSILFLDEATSHLNADLEKRINENLRSLGIPMVVIAHRQETISMADRVLRMENGSLIECDGSLPEDKRMSSPQGTAVAV